MKRYYSILTIFFLTFAVGTSPCLYGQHQSRMAAWQMRCEMQEVSPFFDIPWTSVGPRMAGSRTSGLASPGGHSPLIYAGFADGNIWKSENSGISWKPIFEHQPSSSIADITIDKNNPDIIWVGTGDMVTSEYPFSGTGVYKSEDGGESWRHLGLSNSYRIGRVVIDPEDNNTVYVCVQGFNNPNEERGLQKTTDGGQTWENILIPEGNSGICDVAVNPINRSLILAASFQSPFGPGSKIYYSSDSGVNWSVIEKGLPKNDSLGRIALAIAPSKPERVYAIIDNRGRHPGGWGVIGAELYRSDDSGKTWELANKDTLTTHYSWNRSSMGHVFGDILISPDNPDEIYILGINLRRSKDGGKTFEVIYGKEIKSLNNRISTKIHLDQHDLWINPENPDHLILGNDGGLYISRDRGDSWLYCNDIPVAQIYRIGYDMDSPYNIYAGSQDNAGFRGPSDYDAINHKDIPDPWQHLWIDIWGGGDGFTTIPDPSDKNYIYYLQQHGSMYHKNLSTGEHKYIKPEPGLNIIPGSHPLTDSSRTLRWNWDTPFIISTHNPGIIYTAANYIFRSINRGKEWQCISGDLSGGSHWRNTIRHLAESPIVPSVLYSAADTGFLFVSKDMGATWTRTGESLPYGGFSSIVPSFHDKATLYCSLERRHDNGYIPGIFKSTDFGTTWKDIGSSLPGEIVISLCEDPVKPGILYAGTNIGVFVTVDDGKTWDVLGNNLPSSPVYDLKVHPVAGELIAGTFGRGIYKINIEPVRKYCEYNSYKYKVLWKIAGKLPALKDDTGDYILSSLRNMEIFFSNTGKPFTATATLINDEQKTIFVKKIQVHVGVNHFSWNLLTETGVESGLGYLPFGDFAASGEYKFILKKEKKEILSTKISINPSK